MHQHLELGDVGKRLEGKPLIGNRALRIHGPEFPPQALSVTRPRVQYAGDPLVERASRHTIDHAQRILEDTTRGGLAAPKPDRHAGVDVVGLPGDRPQVSTEPFEHPRWIARDLELRKVRVDGKPCLATCGGERVLAHGG